MLPSLAPRFFLIPCEEPDRCFITLLFPWINFHSAVQSFSFLTLGPPHYCARVENAEANVFDLRQIWRHRKLLLLAAAPFCLFVLLFHRLPTLLPSSRGEHDRPKHCRLVAGLQQPFPRPGLQGLWYRGARVWFRRCSSSLPCSAWFSVCGVVTGSRCMF